MQNVILGKTGLSVSRLSFGALPIQRTPLDESVRILHKAAESGINYFDTARFYTDSEAKLGAAFSARRDKLIISTKTMAKDRAGILADLAVSLAELKTDYIDLYQFHNPKTVPMPGDGTERYETFAELKQKGVIRAVGITNHALKNAQIAIESGLYETLQFPFSLMNTPEEENLAVACKKADMGFIAMKALCGGLITNIPAAFAYMRQFDNVVPIWGIQHMRELDEFLDLEAAPPGMTEDIRRQISGEKEALGGQFCRSCGYCMPCPQGIEILNVARMNRLLRRSPWQTYATPEWKEKMALAKTCINCGVCASRCPYSLDTPRLVQENALDYEQFMAEHDI